MAYIGKQPTPVPLSASDLNDDIVSLAKMASGTDGNLITYDASGNPAAVATGDDGQVLTSAGAGAAPAFEAASGGGLIRLATNTLSGAVSSSNFDDTYVTTTYNTYMLTWNGITGDTDGYDLVINLSDDNGSTFQANKCGHTYHSLTWAGAPLQQAYTAGARVMSDGESDDSDGRCGGTAWLSLSNSATGSGYSYINSLCTKGAAGGASTGYGYHVFTMFYDLNRPNYIRFEDSEGNNLDTGEFVLYGLARA